MNSRTPPKGHPTAKQVKTHSWAWRLRQIEGIDNAVKRIVNPSARRRANRRRLSEIDAKARRDWLIAKRAS